MRIFPSYKKDFSGNPGQGNGNISRFNFANGNGNIYGYASSLRNGTGNGNVQYPIYLIQYWS